MSEHSSDLRVAAATLAKHAPAEWADFRVALQNFVVAELEFSTKAPTGEAQRQLGYCQCLIQLRNLMLYDLENITTKPPIRAR